MVDGGLRADGWAGVQEGWVDGLLRYLGSFGGSRRRDRIPVSLRYVSPAVDTVIARRT